MILLGAARLESLDDDSCPVYQGIGHHGSRLELLGSNQGVQDVHSRAVVVSIGSARAIGVTLRQVCA